jgi:glutamate mutase epsilon subunit
MTNENLQPNVGQMLRMTGNNTAQFMEQVAVHLEKMEAEVVRLTARVYELEAGQDDFK